jgi:hypothetical protein
MPSGGLKKRLGGSGDTVRAGLSPKMYIAENKRERSGKEKPESSGEDPTGLAGIGEIGKAFRSAGETTEKRQEQ